MDVVVESASWGGRKIFLFGHAIVSATPRTGVMYLAAFAASSGVGLAGALALVRIRRMERRMKAELEDRREEISRGRAPETGRDPRAMQLFEWKRDNLLDEMQQIRERTAALRRAGLEQRASLERFAVDVGDLEPGAPIPELIVIPDVDLGDDDAVTASSDSDSAADRDSDPSLAAERSLSMLFGRPD